MNCTAFGGKREFGGGRGGSVFKKRSYLELVHVNVLKK